MSVMKRTQRGLWLGMISLLMGLGAGSAHAQSGFGGLSEEQVRMLVEQRGATSGPIVMPSGQSSGSNANPAPPSSAGPAQDAPEERKVGAGSGLVVEIGSAPASGLGEESEQRQDRFYLVANDRGEVTLGRYGTLQILGYTEAEVRARLRALPNLALREIRVVILPNDPSDAASLRPFGTQVFGSGQARPTMESYGTIPPPDYAFGPGDSVILQYFGKINAVYELPVLRDGRINVPELGPVQVAGLNFDSIRDELTTRVKDGLIGVNASVSMGALRSIGVTVLGEVSRPGMILVPAGARAVDALLMAGGIGSQGSYRSVAISRSGRQIAKLDLYDLLTAGSSRANLQLQQDDTLFVETAGGRVSVLGEVRRPAKYELGRERTVADVLRLAGGATDAAGVRYFVDRINSLGERDVLSGELRDAAAQTVQRGDVVRVERAMDRLDQAIQLSGHFESPGYRPWSSGTRLLDVIPDVRRFKPRADLDYLIILREVDRSRRMEQISVSYRAALAAPNDVQFNIALQPRDEIVALATDDRRAQAIEDLQQRINPDRQARRQATINAVGQLRFPGQYLLEPEMTVARLIDVAGGPRDSAIADRAEFLRFSINEQGEREAYRRNLNLTEGSDDLQLQLEPDDVLTLYTIPNWGSRTIVRVEGEVRFPGTYTMTRGERLSDLLQRVGGVNELGSLEAAVFQRERLKEREREELRRLRQRLSEDLRALAVQQDATEEEQEGLLTARRLLLDTEAIQPMGRLVVDFAELTSGGPEDVLLQDGDVLIVPPKIETVSVIGEVNMINSHRWREGLRAKDYLELAGGITHRASLSQAYIVRANGEVTTMGGTWFGRSPRIYPGDTIVVPLDTDRVRPIQLAKDITQIFSQVALTIAAFNSVGVF